MIRKYKETLNQKEYELLDKIHHDTLTKIQHNQLHEVGCDALTLSVDLYSDRSNVSRILNKLTRHGILTKIQGRPTLFFDKLAVEEYFPGLFLPELLPKNTTLLTFIEDHYHFEVDETTHYHSVFGFVENESLYQLKNEAEAALHYPNQSLPLLLHGSENTGKKTFAKSLFTIGLQEGIFKDETAYLFLDCSDTHTRANFIPDLLEELHENEQKKFIVIYQYEFLSAEQHFLLHQLVKEKTISQSQHRDKLPINAFFLLITTTNHLEKKLLYQNFPIKLAMPDLKNRSMKEKLLFIFNLFQNEANLLKREVHFSHNILNCFALSDYQENIYGLQLEIRRAIALASYTNKKTPKIEIVFDNLSDELLNKMNNDNEKIDELYQIYTLLEQPIKGQDITFIPVQPSPIFNFIKKNIFYDQYKQPYDKLDVVCPQEITLDFETESLTLLKNFYHNKGDSLQLYNKTLNQLMDQSFEPLGLDHQNRLVNGLIFHLSNLANEKAVGNHDAFLPLELTNEISPLVLDFSAVCATELDLYFTHNELKFIQSYLDTALLIAQQKKITVALVSGTLENATIFCDFANSLPYSNKACPLNYTLCSTDKSHFIEELVALDEGKGVVFLLNDDVPRQVAQIIKEYAPKKIIIEKITLQNIEKIMRLTDDPFIFLHNLAEMFQAETSLEQHDEDELLDILKTNILEKSLVFLNPHKIITSAVICFYHVLEELDMDYSAPLFIRFILHLSFLVERILLNNILTYHDLHLFINQHHRLHTVIEKHLAVIQRTYNIIIPQAEIAYLSEIFLEHQAEKTSS